MTEQTLADTGLRSAAAEVERFFESVLGRLAGWAPEFAAQFAGPVADGGVTAAALEAFVAPYATEALDSVDPPIYGAGFVAAAALLADGGSPLAWWQGPDRAQLIFSAGVDDRTYVDYQRLEWFRVPQRTLARHVAGPYVDYLCSNEITLTSAVPVVVAETFVGVGAIDVLVESLEAPLMRHLDAAAGPLTLVNANGRVVISADPRLNTGDAFLGLTEEADAAATLAGRPHAECAGLPFRVIG